MKKIRILISILGFFYQAIMCSKNPQELDLKDLSMLDSFSFTPPPRDPMLGQEQDSIATSSISPLRQISHELVDIKELYSLIDEFNVKDKTSDEISKFLDELRKNALFEEKTFAQKAKSTALKPIRLLFADKIKILLIKNDQFITTLKYGLNLKKLRINRSSIKQILEHNELKQATEKQKREILIKLFEQIKQYISLSIEPKFEKINGKDTNLELYARHFSSLTKSSSNFSFVSALHSANIVKKAMYFNALRINIKLEKIEKLKIERDLSEQEKENFKKEKQILEIEKQALEKENQVLQNQIMELTDNSRNLTNRLIVSGILKVASLNMDLQKQRGNTEIAINESETLRFELKNRQQNEEERRDKIKQELRTLLEEIKQENIEDNSALKETIQELSEELQKININTSSLKQTIEELRQGFQKIHQKFQAKEQNLEKEIEELKEELLKTKIQAKASTKLNVRLFLNDVYENVRLNLEKQNLEKK